MPAISKNEMGSGRHREKRKSANVYLTQTLYRKNLKRMVPLERNSLPMKIDEL